MADQSTGQCRQLETSLSNYRETISQLEDRIRQLECTVEARDTSTSKLQLKNKEIKLLLKQTQEALIRQEQVVADLTRALSEERNKTELGRMETGNEKRVGESL